MELTHIWGILFISLHAMVPITLAAIGETIEESAGLFNIGLEGILLFGALAGALGAQASGSALVGLFTGMGVGALIGLVLARSVRHFAAANSSAGSASIFWL